MLPSIASVFNTETLSIYGLILLVSCYGVIKPMYIITQGYGFSMSAVGASVALLLSRYVNLNGFSFSSVVLFLQSIVLVAYGLRLASFLWERRKKESYTRNQHGSFGSRVGFAYMIPLLLMVTFLYFCYGLPVLVGYRALVNGYHFSSVVHLVGTLIMVVGLLTESTADSQKSRSKLEKPDRFCDTGVYRYCRMPNYFGELLHWTGCTLSCIGDDMSILQLGLCLFGIICSYNLMLSAAKRLDKSQFDRYHGDPQYMQYRKEVPVLFPFTRWYSMIDVEKAEYSVCLTV